MPSTLVEVDVSQQVYQSRASRGTPFLPISSTSFLVFPSLKSRILIALALESTRDGENHFIYLRLRTVGGL
jgi:hypothetical protein